MDARKAYNRLFNAVAGSSEVKTAQASILRRLLPYAATAAGAGGLGALAGRYLFPRHEGAEPEELGVAPETAAPELEDYGYDYGYDPYYEYPYEEGWY